MSDTYSTGIPFGSSGFDSPLVLALGLVGLSLPIYGVSTLLLKVAKLTRNHRLGREISSEITIMDAVLVLPIIVSGAVLAAAILYVILAS